MAANPLEIKILLVGPNFVYQKTLRHMLHSLGFEDVDQTKDGAYAWEAIKRIRPDIVISQWNMPEITGMALLKLIRADDAICDTPVILCTDEITKPDVVKAGEAGVNAILIEPVEIDNLESKMRIIMEFEMSPGTREAKALMAKGDLYLKEERFESALREYEKVLEILESAEVYYNIGYIKTAKGEYDEALAAFRKATQINQMFAKAYKAMAEVYLRMGRKDMAEKYLQMAGEIFLEREMHESAESIFNEILKLNPDTINVYNSLGILYRRQNRLEDSIKLYEKAIKINPTDENIHFNMGRAYLELDNPHMAKKCFIKALKINPNFDTAKGMIDAIESAEKSVT
ncbi:MAG: tetratricopeptide repeat protein [Bacteriovoracaceae bacterium]|jgi:tetratricopeptide (TPR) repeat protein|nr:tetratricopeptide repeat protein [Pseudomonadota bacterium]NLW67236.1 tetratricopeptide repeat protein [Bacteriovoracaceae bacterium]HNU75395.1 tetratricopeptide repeat protein [Deltaproteobacteria bacterium]HRT43917.1 tetratricopeptide repeat protein [Desulfomonilia bacterium]